jgi:hypothetical protein
MVLMSSGATDKLSAMLHAAAARLMPVHILTRCVTHIARGFYLSEIAVANLMVTASVCIDILVVRHVVAAKPIGMAAAWVVLAH